jgi:hypothetical protein
LLPAALMTAEQDGQTTLLSDMASPRRGIGRTSTRTVEGRL